jgi:hypothetical protein
MTSKLAYRTEANGNNFDIGYRKVRVLQGSTRRDPEAPLFAFTSTCQDLAGQHVYVFVDRMGMGWNARALLYFEPVYGSLRYDQLHPGRIDRFSNICSSLSLKYCGIVNLL